MVLLPPITMQFKHNIFQLLVSLDQFLNVLVCMFVEPKEKHWADETFSAHTHRHYTEGRWKIMHWIINHLFFWQDDHCKEAYESELNRVQLPPELREKQ